MRKHFSGSAFARECPYSSGIHRRAAVFFAFCAVAFTLLYLRVGYLSRSPGLAQTARREAQAKIVTLKAQYKAVSEASGLKQRAERMVVEGYTKQQAKEATEIQNALQFIQNDGIIKASSGLPKRVSLPDEVLKATADVEFDNLHGVVPKGSSLSEVYVMAGNGTSTPIRDLKRLYAKYPEAGHPSGWQKKSGTTYSSNGKYVVHWYENDGYVPPVEVKTKGVKLT